MKIILLFFAAFYSLAQATVLNYSPDGSANFAASPAPTYHPSGYVKTGYLTGSNQALHYTWIADGHLSGHYETATIKNGAYVTFSTDGYVVSGTLSGNQSLIVDTFLSIQFKDNTAINFTWERASGGTLLNAETLSYGLGVETITLKSGTAVGFEYGWVTNGTLSNTAQLVPYRNIDGIYTKAKLIGGTTVSFSASRLLYQGSLDYSVAVEYGPSRSAYLSGPATFNQPWNSGYVSHGTTWASSAQTLFAKYYSLTTGYTGMSDWISVPASSTNYFMDGAVYRQAADD
ncbi:MAG: hypothetical protein V4726_16940 [Verrucomicrobiota bacterium]